eukprot:scaffold40313_cov36-Tisochrysis_lutea.AAC.1
MPAWGRTRSMGTTMNDECGETERIVRACRRGPAGRRKRRVISRARPASRPPFPAAAQPRLKRGRASSRQPASGPGSARSCGGSCSLEQGGVCARAVRRPDLDSPLSL